MFGWMSDCPPCRTDQPKDIDKGVRLGECVPASAIMSSDALVKGLCAATSGKKRLDSMDVHSDGGMLTAFHL